MWYLCLFPFVLVSVKGISAYRWAAMAATWFGGQALWLKLAYDLEFGGRNTFVLLWVASLLFMLVNTGIAYLLIKYHT